LNILDGIRIAVAIEVNLLYRIRALSEIRMNGVDGSRIRAGRGRIEEKIEGGEVS
jgi:hypothetical protein